MAEIAAETKAHILDAIGKMLDDPTVEISWACGMKDRDSGNGWLVTDPTKGREIVIKVHGGAVHETL